MNRYVIVVKYILAVLVAATLIHIRCATPYNGSEVKNERSCLYMPDGSPAAGAMVQVIPVSFVPGEASSAIFTAITDGKGGYTVANIPSGCYNIYAKKDSLSHFRDSVEIGINSGLKSDTLGYSVNLKFKVELQQNHDPRSIVVQVLGTSMYFENVDSSGIGILNGMAGGSYRLRLTSTVAGYTPTFVTVTIPEVKHYDSLNETVAVSNPIRLIYTGIPVVTGLQAVFDPVNSIVKVSWDSVVYNDLYDYVIYRENPDTNILSAQWIAHVTRPEFIDSIDNETSYPGKKQIQLRYRVAVRNKSLKVGETFSFCIATIDLSLLTVTLFKSDTQSFYPDSPLTLRIVPSLDIPGKLRYFWSFGNAVEFAETVKPETTITISIPGDSIITSLPCRVKVMNEKGTVFSDTLRLGSQFVWEKIGESPDGSSIGYSAINVSDRILLFCRGGSGAWKQVWSSGDGKLWQLVNNSLPFSKNSSRPLLFKNRIWVLDRGDTAGTTTLWSSDSGIIWESRTISLLSGKGYAADYDVLSTMGEQIVLVNYYPLCLGRGNCGTTEPLTSWTTSDGNVWQTASLPGSLFPDRNDEPNRYFIACESGGRLMIGGAWRTAYLINPPGASYRFRVWNATTAAPVEIPFPITGLQTTFTEYYPLTAEVNGKQFLSIAASYEKVTNTELWVLQKDTTWYRCSGNCFVDTTDIKPDYHTLVAFHQKLLSISNAGVWRVKQ